MPSHCVPGAPTTADSVQPQRRGLRCRLQRCARLHSAHSFLRPPDRGRPHTALHYQHLHVRVVVPPCAQQCPPKKPLSDASGPRPGLHLRLCRAIVPFGEPLSFCRWSRPFAHVLLISLSDTHPTPASRPALIGRRRALQEYTSPKRRSRVAPRRPTTNVLQPKIHCGKYHSAGSRNVMALRRRRRERSRIAT
jgi:hypothetical protein